MKPLSLLCCVAWEQGWLYGWSSQACLGRVESTAHCIRTACIPLVQPIPKSMQASRILTQLIVWATSSTNGAFTWHVSVIHILSCPHMDSFTSQTNTNWFAITLLSQYPVCHPSLPLGPYIPSSTDLFDSGLKSSWRIPGPLGERRLSCLLDVLCSGYLATSEISFAPHSKAFPHITHWKKGSLYLTD